MRIKKLFWAGIECQTERCRVLLDPLENVEPLSSYLGRPHDPVLHIEESGVVHALITHRHPDHYDPATLRRVVGPMGTVFCPRSLVDEVRASGLRAHGMDS